MSDPMVQLAKAIGQGSPGASKTFAKLIGPLFDKRYAERHLAKPSARAKSRIIREGLTSPGKKTGMDVPFAGLIHPDNPTTGAFKGISVAWMPSGEAGTLIAFFVGGGGLGPDEQRFDRPGLHRRAAALAERTALLGTPAWSRIRGGEIEEQIPPSVRARFPGFEEVFERHGPQVYCIAKVPRNAAAAKKVVRGFLDLYAYERGWEIRKAAVKYYNRFQAELRAGLFPAIDAEQVNDLIRKRRFVILQGPPGSGKSHIAGQVVREFFGGNGNVVQFHPGVTYENFIVGVEPDVQQQTSAYRVRPGWLPRTMRMAQSRPCLLVLEDIHRTDLAKVLGEAIYLFEADEMGGKQTRQIELNYQVNESRTLIFPGNLYVLATMNSADRQAKPMDLAVRRRFAFLTTGPDRSVVEQWNLPAALRVFDRLANLFVEHAPEGSLELLPAQSYYKAANEDELQQRFRHELIPLLDEYVKQGYLGSATPELHVLRNDLLWESRAAANPSRKAPLYENEIMPREAGLLDQPTDPAAVRVAVPKHTVDEAHAMGLGVLAAELDLS